MSRNITALIIHAAVVGIAVSALIQVGWSLPLKAIVLLGFGLAILVIQLLLTANENLSRIYTVNRLIFVSLESARLAKNDAEPATQKLMQDIESEKEQAQITEALRRRTTVTLIYWVVYLATVIMAAIITSRILFSGGAA